MSTNFQGSVPLTEFDSSSSGGSVGGTGLSSSPLQSFDAFRDGLDHAEHEESAAQLAVRRYSDSLKKYTSAAFDSLKEDLRERNVALPAAPKGFHPVPQAAGLV